MWVKANPNPNGIYVEDCVVRAIAIATNRSWDDIYFHVCLQGYVMKNMPSVNKVWGNYLKSIGFERTMLPTHCPDCYTVRDFSNEFYHGVYIVATGSHLVAVINGDYLDARDSGDELLVEVWERK